jgi:FAD/FMN-containing dehydrogenase
VNILRHGEPGYEERRQGLVWNAVVPERYPAVIATAQSRDDVVEALALARREGLKVTVRSGGHSWVGTCLRQGGLVIDLSGLSDLVVDPTTMTATAGPGATNGQLASALETASLGFPIGHSPTVGLGGYLLGGGLGWNPRVWGPACANVTAIEVVTADGEIVDDDPDLLWAAKGAGPGFPGVVTRFDLRLHPLPKAITGSTYVYPLAEARALSDWLTGLLPKLPPEVEVAFILRAGPPRGADWSGTAAVLAPTVFAEWPAEAEALLEPFEACPVRDLAVFAETCVPLSYSEIQGRAYLPEGHRYAVDNLWSNADLADVATTIGNHLRVAPSPMTATVSTLRPPVPPEDSAFTMTGAFSAGVYTVWREARDDAANVAWLRSLMAELQPYSVGTFIPETDLAAPGSDAARSFTPEVWSSLEAVRRRVDPDGLFHTFLRASHPPGVPVSPAQTAPRG